MDDFLALLRSGFDTVEIARVSSVPEHQVYNELHEQREAERLRIKHRDYQRKVREEWNCDDRDSYQLGPIYPKLIPYAGKDD